MVTVGAGAYSNSRGERTVRGHVAEFISERDGFACDMEDVFLTDGASAGVVKILQCLIRDEKDGVRAPFALLCAVLRSPEMIYHVRVRVPCACAVWRVCVCACAAVQILIPIPQYPLYSATIPMLGGTQLKYYLVRIAIFDK